MTRSGSSSTGALVVAGGVGIQGDLYNLPLLQSSSVTAFFDNVNIAGNLVFPQGSLFTVNNLQANGYANVSSDLNVGGNAVIIGNLTVDGTLNYTNLTISGALTVDGESYLNGGISVVNNSTSMFSVNEATGNTIIGPTSGTTATLDVCGPITGHNGLTVSSGSTSLQNTTTTTLTASGLITGNAGLNIPSGKILTVNNIVGNGTDDVTMSNGGHAIIIGSSTASYGNVYITGGGNTSSGDSSSSSNAGFIIKTGGVYIQQDLMVYGGDIYGPNKANLNIGSASSTVTIGSSTPNNVLLSSTPDGSNTSAVATVGYVNNHSATTITTNGTDPGVTLYPVMTTGVSSTGLPPYVDTNGLSYNATNNELTATGFSNLNGGIRVYNNSNQMFSVTPGTGSTVIGLSGGQNGNLTVNGPTTIYNTCYAQSFNSGSDYRIKKDVTTLNDAFNVDKLRPVTYTNKNTKKQDIGFIAHEVQEEFPYLVSGEKDGEEMQSLNYIGLIGVLVKEIQELKKRVHVLENK
jgi:hypothetical protein